MFRGLAGRASAKATSARHGRRPKTSKMEIEVTRMVVPSCGASEVYLTTVVKTRPRGIVPGWAAGAHRTISGRSCTWTSVRKDRLRTDGPRANRQPTLKNTYASETPVTRRVYAPAESGDHTTISREIRAGEPHAITGASGTALRRFAPAAAHIQNDNQEKSYLAALDATTGNIVAGGTRRAEQLVDAVVWKNEPARKSSPARLCKPRPLLRPDGNCCGSHRACVDHDQDSLRRQRTLARQLGITCRLRQRRRHSPGGEE
jgi:hypothetical protein